MGGLLDLLSEDVVLYADGGGKGPAVPNAIRGADKVARGILGGLEKLVPKRVVRRIVEVNGQPGVAGYLDGKPFSVITLESEGDDGRWKGRRAGLVGLDDSGDLHGDESGETLAAAGSG